jgi:predicted DCC family thiol-disulfide oxidoreductase YuxK
MLNHLIRDIDSRPVAFMRIVTGVASVLLLIETRETLQRVADGSLAIPSFSWSPTVTSELVVAYTALGLLFAVALTAGVFSAAAAIGVAATQAAALLTEQQTYSNHLVLLISICSLLAFANPGGAYSLRDRSLSNRSPVWPLVLIQTQIATMYFYTALSKINGTFLSGDMLTGSLRPMFVVGNDDAYQVLALITIATEFFLAAGLWFARTRPFALVIGLGLHASIALMLKDPYPLIPFGLLSLCTYVLFLRLPEPGSRLVVWDSHCSFCYRWIALFRALDLFRIHTFVGSKDPMAFESTEVTREQLAEAMQLRDRSDGTAASGFDAVRRILEVSPFTFLVAPILGIAPVRAIGVRVYKHVADNRTCELPRQPSVPA